MFEIDLTNRTKASVWFCLMVGVFSGVLYLNTLGNLFTNWDDAMVYSNYQIRSLDWNNLQVIFTYVKGSTYQPIRILSYAIDYHFWKLNPLGYHITNILFYALTCVLVFLCLRELSLRLREWASSDSHNRVALLGSLLFAAHPIHVEAVAWLAARKEVLQGFFFFLAFFLYLKAREAAARRYVLRLSLALFFFLLAVLSKPSAIVFPAVVLLYEGIRARDQWIDFIKHHKVFLGVAIGISILFTGILLRIMVDAGGIKPYRGGSLLNNSLISMYAFLYYLKLLALTINYSAAYTIPLPRLLWGLQTVLVIGALCLLVSICFWSLRRTKVIFFSFFFFVLTLLPFLNLIPISTLLADRYLFLASFPFVFLMGILADKLFRYEQPGFSKGFFKVLSITLFSMALVFYSLMTLRRNEIWQNSYTLWSDAVEKYPDSNTSNAMMGVVYMELGMDGKAVTYLEKAVQLLPYDSGSRNNLGIVYGRLNQPEKALRELMTAIWLVPGDLTYKFNLSSLYLRQKRCREAREVMDSLLSIEPGNAYYHFRKGMIWKEEGRPDEAILELKRSSELASQIVNPYVEIGNIYSSRLNKREEAISSYTRGVEIVVDGGRREDDLRWMVQDLQNRH